MMEFIHFDNLPNPLQGLSGWERQANTRDTKENDEVFDEGDGDAGDHSTCVLKLLGPLQEKPGKLTLETTPGVSS